MLTRDLGKLSIPVVPKLTPLRARMVLTKNEPSWFRYGVKWLFVLWLLTENLFVLNELDQYPVLILLNGYTAPMTLTPFEISLYQHLTPFFAGYQYELLLARKQYRRVTGAGFQNVILSPAFYQDETLLEVSFGCRNEQVEQIAQQFLNNPTDYRSDANTLIISIGKFNSLQYFRYKIHRDDELVETCAHIEDFFSEQGLAFLNASGTLPELDRLLNEHPDQPCRYVYNQTHRCYKGLIAARLNHNPHFDGLIDSYRHLLVRQTQNPHEQRHFERLVVYLQHYSAN